MDRMHLIGNDLFNYIHEKNYCQIKNSLNNLFTEKTVYLKNIYFTDKNLDYVLLDIVITFKELDQEKLAVIYCSTPENVDPYMIYPKDLYYLAWVFIITSTLLFIIIYSPYDITFNDSKVTDMLDFPTTIIFFFDIIINFNVAYETDDHRYITDRRLIAINYLQGWFTFDLLSTLPISMLFESISNSDLIKSSKVLRLVRFIKLLRLLKFSRISFEFNKNELTKELYKHLRQNQGYFDLLKNMMLIYLMAHYYTIFFYIIEEFYICSSSNQCWLNDYMNDQHTPDFSVYNYILYKNLKIALGIDSFFATSNIEVYLSMCWMFIGLSMYGFGIGNISAYLTYSNKNELEQYQTQNYFKEFCFMNNIDYRIENAINESIENYYSKYLDRELESYDYLLPKYVYESLETTLNAEFVKQFPLFEKLGQKAISFLKKYCHKYNNKILTKKGIQLNEIIFILKGSLNVYDDKMNIITYYEINEIYGMYEFYEYFKNKYNVDIESILSNHNLECDKRVKNFMKSKFLQNIQQKLNQNQSKKLKPFGGFSIVNSESDQDASKMTKNLKKENDNLINRFKSEFEKNNLDFEMIQDLKEEYYLLSNYNAFGSDDINYISVPYHIVEELLFQNTDDFMYMYKYFNIYNRDINPDEWDVSNQYLQSFKDENNLNVIIRVDGTIYDVNDAFCTSFRIDESEVYDKQFIELLKTRGDEGLNMISSIDALDEEFDQNQEYTITINNYSQKVHILSQGYKKIVNYDRKSNKMNYYMTLAKSLIYVNLLEIQLLQDKD